ncbi:MAG TPA: hypothetical protein VK973_05005 [Arenicellales bacterium]|nr:hypothetical protein [Arenicellales bacterium]
MKRIVVLLMALSLGACAGYSRVPSGEVDLGNGMSVQTPIEWSRITAGKHEMWTRDGNVLQELWIAKGLTDGEVLIPPVPGRREELPEYDESITLLEVADFIKASMAGQGFQQVELRDVRPRRFGADDGVEAELEFLTEDGLLKQGRFVAIQQEGKLYVVMYSGVAGHYFESYRDEAEQVISSIATDF